MLWKKSRKQIFGSRFYFAEKSGGGEQELPEPPLPTPMYYIYIYIYYWLLFTSLIVVDLYFHKMMCVCVYISFVDVVAFKKLVEKKCVAFNMVENKNLTVYWGYIKLILWQMLASAVSAHLPWHSLYINYSRYEQSTGSSTPFIRLIFPIAWFQYDSTFCMCTPVAWSTNFREWSTVWCCDTGCSCWTWLGAAHWSTVNYSTISEVTSKKGE